ncbi:response regulator [Streptomyces sp. Ru87]|uniref:Response regulator n=2 Tax=Streptomyces TaxID=1883 RepID=A0ABQ7FJH4_9ACTN|nr:response regulator [Streptomyces lycii]PGH51548.1 response regulator [Streptomyces sp. Ru87]
MICDDNIMLLEVLREVVESEPDMTVVATAQNAEEAIRLAGRHTPDLAVLDVRFPGGGPYAAREIARRSPRTGILAFSAHGDSGAVGEMRHAGVTEYLVKGATNREFLTALRRLGGRLPKS